jgi:hypothetical protein
MGRDGTKGGRCLALALMALAAMPLASAAPVNDNFANATVLSGVSADVAVDLNGATREVGEPAPGNWWEAQPNSVWFRWTAPVTGKVFFSPHSELSSSPISIYTGAAVNALTQVGTAPYDSSWWGPPIVSYRGWLVEAQAGTVYHIAVWQYSYYPPDPTIRLSLLHQEPFPQANDNFANATALPANGAATQLAGHTILATHQRASGEPMPDWLSPYWLPAPLEFPTLWYAFTPDFTGFAEFHTSAAICPLEIAVFTGSTLSGLSEVTVNEAAGPDGKTVVRWKCTSGTPYRIRVAAFDSPRLTPFNASFTRLTPASTVRSKVLEARIELSLQEAGCLQAAGTLLQEALVAEPNDPEANLLRALTRLALIGERPDFKSLVGTMTGDATPETDPYFDGNSSDRFGLSLDGDGDPVLPASSNPREVVTWMNSHLLPELAAIRAHLDKVPAAFTTALTASETGAEHLEIDRADVLAVSAATHALEMLVHFLTTYELSVPLANLMAWEKSGQLTAQQVRATYTNLLRFSATDRRQQFRQQFTQVRLAGEAAVAFAKNSRTQPLMHLWHADDIDPDDEATVINGMQEMEDSFDNGTVIQIGRQDVNLSRFLATTASLRDWLPTFSGNAPLSGTLPDPTFSGIFPAFSAENAEALIGRLSEVVNLGVFSGYIGHMLDGFLPEEKLPGADPDRDGRSNLTEYVFGGDAGKPEAPPHVAVTVQTSGQDVAALRVVFSRRSDVTDATYVVAVSDDLTTWDRSGAKAVMVGSPVPNGDGLTESVEYEIRGLAGEAPPKFVRLEATLH